MSDLLFSSFNTVTTGRSRDEEGGEVKAKSSPTALCYLFYLMFHRKEARVGEMINDDEAKKQLFLICLHGKHARV